MNILSLATCKFMFINMVIWYKHWNTIELSQTTCSGCYSAVIDLLSTNKIEFVWLNLLFFISKSLNQANGTIWYFN